MNRIVETILNGVLRRFISDPKITDLVFREIEKHYMRQYNQAHRRNPRINAQIGKHIKQYLGTGNIGRSSNRKSSLIKSYTLHGL
jgi:hypothetical protein